MASDREYLNFILEQLSEVHGVSARPMMGEFLLYLDGRIFGGIYDDRLLVKPVRAALERMPGARREEPYPGGSPMLLVEEVDDREFLCALVRAMYGELPEPKRRTAARHRS